MAIALSNFEGLCGFRPYYEIKFFLEGTYLLFMDVDEKKLLHNNLFII